MFVQLALNLNVTVGAAIQVVWMTDPAPRATRLVSNKAVG